MQLSIGLILPKTFVRLVEFLTIQTLITLSFKIQFQIYVVGKACKKYLFRRKHTRKARV